MVLRPILAVLLVLDGCTTTHTFPATEVLHLNHISATDTRRLLRASDGEDIGFYVSTTTLTLVLKSGHSEEHRYSSIEIANGQFIGVTLEGQTLRIPLDTIDRLEVEEVSAGKTVAAIVFIPILIVLGLIIIVLIGCAAAPNNCSLG